jgi:hypothetical protein
MKNRDALSQMQLNSIIMEDDDIIETSVEEVVISSDDDCQRNKFYENVEKYKNTLSLCMRDKSMITIPLGWVGVGESLLFTLIHPPFTIMFEMFHEETFYHLKQFPR